MSIRSLGCHVLRIVVIACSSVAAFMVQSAAAQGRTVTVAWDPSPDAHTTGYFVYVGSEPGVYSDRYDAGAGTTFVFATPLNGPYYFAVASYTHDGVTGPRSEEVSTVSPDPLSGIDPLLSPVTPSEDSSLTSPPEQGSQRASERLCDAGSPRCLTGVEWARGNGRIDAIANAPDGRVFAVDGGIEIRVADATGWTDAPALTAARADETFADLVVDPNFAATRYVFTSVIRHRPDGSGELSIVRYRDVANRLGEGATIVTGLPVPPRKRAPFTVDADGRIYVAMPTSDAHRDPYDTTILRFDGDGSVPADSRASSPIFATGLSQPATLVWDGAAARLWLAGVDASGGAVLSFVPLGHLSSSEWPVPAVNSPLGTSVAPTGLSLPVVAASSDQYALAMPLALYRRNGDAVETYAAGPLGQITALTGAADGTMFVVVQPPDRAGGRLLELRPEKH